MTGMSLRGMRNIAFRQRGELAQSSRQRHLTRINPGTDPTNAFQRANDLGPRGGTDLHTSKARNKRDRIQDLHAPSMGWGCDSFLRWSDWVE